MLHAWNAASWLQRLTQGMETEPATKVWGKYNLSQRQFEGNTRIPKICGKEVFEAF